MQASTLTTECTGEPNIRAPSGVNKFVHPRSSTTHLAWSKKLVEEDGWLLIIPASRCPSCVLTQNGRSTVEVTRIHDDTRCASRSVVGAPLKSNTHIFNSCLLHGRPHEKSDGYGTLSRFMMVKNSGGTIRAQHLQSSARLNRQDVRQDTDQLELVLQPRRHCCWNKQMTTSGSTIRLL